MKVAVPSDDGVSIAPRFGRARGLLLFTVHGVEVQPAGYRPNRLPEHARSCSRAERATRHQLVVDALSGVGTVIARTMGAQMYDNLLACGFDVVLTDVQDARSAVELLAVRALTESGELDCSGARM